VVEKLSMNLARAALTAQGAIAEMALRQADRPAALLAGPVPRGAGADRGDGPLAAQPDRLMRARPICSRNIWSSGRPRRAG